MRVSAHTFACVRGCMCACVLLCVDAFEVELLWLLSEYICWFKWLKGSILMGNLACVSVRVCVCEFVSVVSYSCWL